MHFSLQTRTVNLSVGEFASFSLGPQEDGGGTPGLWRAQLGQHWHHELQKRTLAEAPDALFEIPIEGRVTHRGWTFLLQGRIDQRVGSTLREIKSVLRPLPADEAELRADYPSYFLQLATYVVLHRTNGPADRVPPSRDAGAPALRAELVFVEAGAGLVQTVVLAPFDDALVFHQLDAVVGFLNLQQRAAERRRHLRFHSPFTALRPGQETIQADLLAALGPSNIDRPESKILLLEAPTGYGKTGCVLEFALGQLRAGRYERLIWLTGKSTGQIQVMHTLAQMGVSPPGAGSEAQGTPAPPVPAWQVRNKAEHCVNHTFHCVRDGCDFLRGGAERWPGSGLARFYTDENQPRDLDSLRAAGRQAMICPYEITRAALPFNDVWVGDFNYVFAPDNRGVFFEQPGFDPAQTLLVVDEAHNLPSRVAGAFSLTAVESDARLLLAELDHLRAPPALVLAVDEWTRLLGSLTPAESLDPMVEADVRDLLDRLARLAANTPLDYAALGPHHSETLWSFVSRHTWLEHADLSATQSRIENQKSKIAGLLWVPRSGQLEFTCLDAAPEIGATLREFGGVVLMSATLQPYAEFAESCGLERNTAAGFTEAGPGSATPTTGPSGTYTTLHAPTPWRADAYDIAVDLRVDTTFRNRASHYRDTAATIVALAEAAAADHRRLTMDESLPPSAVSPPSSVPRPQVSATRCVAVFFPSYAYAEAVQKTLADYGSVLRVALQPKLPDLAAQTAWVEENLALSDVLFLVLGSSFAEGIDLLGGRVAHAMVVGPALPEVNAVQKAKLTALDHLGRDAAFRRVYQIPGLQKVNQALGRLVRAPGQRAKVLLHCRRFAEPGYSSLLATDYQFYREIADDAALREWLAAKH